MGKTPAQKEKDKLGARKRREVAKHEKDKLNKQRLRKNEHNKSYRARLKSKRHTTPSPLIMRSPSPEDAVANRELIGTLERSLQREHNTGMAAIDSNNAAIDSNNAAIDSNNEAIIANIEIQQRSAVAESRFRSSISRVIMHPEEE